MAQPIVKRGSVVLICYPFTDLTGAKVRPAIVLTPNHLLTPPSGRRARSVHLFNYAGGPPANGSRAGTRTSVISKDRIEAPLRAQNAQISFTP
jgi:hypothetical protein